MSGTFLLEGSLIGGSISFDQVFPGPLPQSDEAAGLVQDLQIEFFETASNGETGLATNIAINIIEVLNEESSKLYSLDFTCVLMTVVHMSG